MPSDDAKSQESRLITEYVVKNIDAAIENGWVKVYYQPVIRALTGQLCGAESLARWIDPEVGFLTPDKFIGALESCRQIHKLDCFIIQQVCSNISDRIHNGLDAVPVSVNLSRLDLEATDMLKVIEDAVDKYDIPRDYIHIEITESMIVSDAALMSRTIDSFRASGYEVWMDDFGSGYSSLTLLKDYQFDTLKLDMGFLSSFNDRSKAIMTSTITMAKDIDIKTLAEGVETPEQIEFLKSIGCGRLQGYFYGKPMPIDDFFSHIEEFGIAIEPRQLRHLYDVASFNARYTDEPLEILEDDGKTFKTLFMNEPYRRQILSQETDLAKLDSLIYHTNSPLLKKYREFANTIEASKNNETFYYTHNGYILCFQAKELVESCGKHIIRGSIRNISNDAAMKKRNSLDHRLKELNHLFDTVMLMNPEKNTVSPLVGKFRYSDDDNADNTNLSERLSRFTNYYIAAADRNRFIEFADFDTIRERIQTTDSGFTANLFRIKQPDGNYEWKEISIMLVPGTSEKEFLFCTKSTAEEASILHAAETNIFNPKDYGLTDSNIDRYSRMWENTVNNSSIKFFWKDNDRRFLGASRAFLDFYGFKIEDILGKTDEDMGWHVDGKAYKSDEIDVLTKGAIIANVPGQCIVKGVVHNIMCYKSPIYENGKIIGLMGYFNDVDEEMAKIDKLYTAKKTDPVTGLMNDKAFMETMIDYAHEYNEAGKNYGLIILKNDKHKRIVEDYGEEFGNKLLKRIGEEILDVTNGSCAVARTVRAYFGLLTYVNEQSELDIIVNELRSRIEAIRTLDGNSITLKIKIGSRLRTDEATTDENMYQFVLQNLV